MIAENPLVRIRESGNPAAATLRICALEPAAPPISRYVTGKFCEHLGSNIYNGMHSEILQNPTFADWPFGGAGLHPDGGIKFLADEEAIYPAIRGAHGRSDLPDAERLVESRQDGLAHWWLREGSRESVRVSPDVAPKGGRAQRIETAGGGQGIAQWLYLPLHRTRQYQWRILARSPDARVLDVSLVGQTAGLRASATAEGLADNWGVLSGALELPADAPADAPYRFSITTRQAGQFVIARALLYPADHVDGADPDVIRFLKESRLPLLRWPGGNFASGYHWEDGIGPQDERPARPNPAWAGVEPNLFGTDEFIAFCRSVGCEPLICVNAGNGTPQEAARWVEYCNGPADTPLGSRRAENGHPEPFNVSYWEIGNELTLRHQVGWTTPAGYVDRYRRFAGAMLAVDPSIQLLACGAPWTHTNNWWAGWNERLFSEASELMRSLTDHILLGGEISASTEPLDVYRDFMAFPHAYEAIYAEARRQMLTAGIREPRLAMTELQLFGRVMPANKGEAVRLTRENLVTPATLAEALYDTLYYHMSVRLGQFIELITHSATVNHGGGLRKERERVYANPCHYAQAMFAEFAGARPIPIELECANYEPPEVLEMLPKGLSVPLVDAVAALTDAGDLLISIVYRGCEAPLSLAIDLGTFRHAGQAEVMRLAAGVPWAANSLQEPQKITPSRETAAIRNHCLSLELAPFAILQTRIPAN